MRIELAKIAPNGVETNLHRITRLIVEPDAVMIVVNSYAAADSAAIDWQEVVPVPLSVLTETPFVSASEHLISSGEYLATGSIVEDEPVVDEAPPLLGVYYQDGVEPLPETAI